MRDDCFFFRLQNTILRSVQDFILIVSIKEAVSEMVTIEYTQNFIFFITITQQFAAKLSS
jgi:hypothetical protein